MRERLAFRRTVSRVTVESGLPNLLLGRWGMVQIVFAPSVGSEEKHRFQEMLAGGGHTESGPNARARCDREVWHRS
jgi:hypothetical protein